MVELTRRTALVGLSVAALAPGAASAQAAVLLKTIAATGETIPAIGMGSWRTFDVGRDTAARSARIEVLRTFFALGGALIDSSPMYGSSQEVIGAAVKTLGKKPVAADKVWIEGRDAGLRQIAETRRRWNAQLDLLQVHNLVDWETHLPELFQMKAQGDIRYVGVTSYAGLRYDDIARIAENEPIDFIQLTYNIADREAEARLLPLALERGIAVIANRPFREGVLIQTFGSWPLPPVAAEIGAATWPQFLLKFVISHPAVTAAIPATRSSGHMAENMASMGGGVPDAATRTAMAKAVGDL